jgi:O-antigen/teichoic acid export membrane protein
VREIVRTPEQAGTLLGTIIGMRMVVAVTALFLMLTSAYLADLATSSLVLIAVIGAGILFHPAQIIEQYFHAKTQAGISTRVVMFASFAGTGWVIYCALGDMQLIWFAAQPVIESAIIAFGFYWILQHRAEEQVPLRFNRQLVRSLIIECWPLAISLALVGVYSNVDRLMINAILGDVETGIYVAATKLSETWYFIPMVIVSSLFPAIVKARHISAEHYRLRLQNLYDLLTWISILISLPVSLMSGLIIRLLYGEVYAAAVPLLRLQIWFGLIVFLSVASGRWLILEGRHDIYLWRTIAGLLMNIILNLILIPRWGIYGAAISFGLSQLIVLLFPAILFAGNRHEDILRILNGMLLHKSLKRLLYQCQ